MNNESILTSVKKALGIPEEAEMFDPELIIHINSVFASLNQMGIGPVEGFEIQDKNSKWNDFLDGDILLSSVKTYVYLKVRMIFDPPQSSMSKDAFEKQIAEFEWRNYVKKDNDERS